MPSPFSLRVRYSKSTTKRQHVSTKEQTNSCTSEPVSEGGGSPVTKMKKARTQNWRDKLKLTNPAKYASDKEKAKSYSKHYRLEMAVVDAVLQKRNLSPAEREDALMWSERKRAYNEGCRRRMRAYASRKKKKKETEKKSKPKTRTAHEKQKAKDRLRKQQQRESLSNGQREEINAKRRDKYRQKNEDISIKLIEEEKRKVLEEKKRVQEVEQQLHAKEEELRLMKEALKSRAS